MTQEDKELLFKDLCARLPYNVICQVEFKENGQYNSKVMLLSGIFTDEAYFTTKGGSIYSNEYKPYLFPMLSMTEEQKKEYNLLRNRVDKELYDTWKSIDYLNTHHFDYRGLIDKGLAIDATGLNIYKTPAPNNPQIIIGTKICLKSNPDEILTIISNDCHEDKFECSDGSVLSLKQIKKYYDII